MGSISCWMACPVFRESEVTVKLEKSQAVFARGQSLPHSYVRVKFWLPSVTQFPGWHTG